MYDVGGTIWLPCLHGWLNNFTWMVCLPIHVLNLVLLCHWLSKDTCNVCNTMLWAILGKHYIYMKQIPMWHAGNVVLISLLLTVMYIDECSQIMDDCACYKLPVYFLHLYLCHYKLWCSFHFQPTLTLSITDCPQPFTTTLSQFLDEMSLNEKKTLNPRPVFDLVCNK